MKILNLGMIVAALGFIAFASSNSFAMPSDTSCKGTLKDGKSVEVVNTVVTSPTGTVSDETITAYVDGKSVAFFPRKTITEGMVNVGTAKDPFMNFQRSARVKRALIKLRYPEQAPDSPVISGTFDQHQGSRTRLPSVGETKCAAII